MPTRAVARSAAAGSFAAALALSVVLLADQPAAYAAGRWPALAVSPWELAAVVTAGSLLSPSVVFRAVRVDALRSALG